MNILVTGSSGHLGEALIRTLQTTEHAFTGIDIIPSAFTDRVGSIADRAFVKQCMQRIDAVFHTATLHKPHIITHSYQDFVDTNIAGTLNLLEEAVAAGVRSFIFTSTTSTFGEALTPPAGAPSAWITEEVSPVPKNIYGVTKTAAEDLCKLFHRMHGLPCIVLKTSRFFPEEDDQKKIRNTYPGDNSKVNEFLYRRVDVEDVVSYWLWSLHYQCNHAVYTGRFVGIAYRCTSCCKTHLPGL
jgi:nucleoside-diphosphate-sugar epimerase